MNEREKEEPVFEIAVVIPRRIVQEKDEGSDCVNVLVQEFRKVGFIVERVHGIAEEFVKLAAPLETLGRAAYELQIKKRTHIGMDLQFQAEDVDAFVRQPDGSIFSWCERFQCYYHLIYGIVNSVGSAKTLKFDGREIRWESGENLLQKLESENIVKQVFPLHDEKKRHKLLKSWALHWWDFTNQPIDEIYSYYGAKIAIYFAFLGMYTRWLLFLAVFGLVLGFVDFGWSIDSSVTADQGCKIPGGKGISLQLTNEHIKLLETDKMKEKEVFQRYEWFGRLLRFRNDAIIIISIICLQLPFELAYAHLYEVVDSDVIKFGLTALYLLAIQYITQFCGKVSVMLIKYENNENTEKGADSLVYKVFGLYFMQTYIGIFYHALLHRNFLTLRKVLVQRLLLSEVLENLLENTLPYFKYSYKKYWVRHKKKKEKGEMTGRIQFTHRAEKEYLKPAYKASISEELEDGLFDDFLELALQFGMIMMFACAFPPAFAFATVNNLMEIRTDALKLLAILRRPVPRAAATVGAWLNIFQFLIVMSICTNCALLVWLYDQEGKWSIEPGLAAILVMEHVLLLIKFGFSRLVPEEPAWVKANRAKYATQAQDMCSKKLLRTISGEMALVSRESCSES
ncbi:anoctamin-like protein At1g73020 isoform X3 [Prosopis cineraria]|uniref:anoctamin-like protein At1g73020 isoform X3 n=1 Tax=Prosopis cineraria TaxID=364024 RepID=UPI0024107277|nr:anoctamin-like protein At1g73020 isoform X3 [Prosopis cineraria]